MRRHFGPFPIDQYFQSAVANAASGGTTILAIAAGAALPILERDVPMVQFIMAFPMMTLLSNGRMHCQEAPKSNRDNRCQED